MTFDQILFLGLGLFFQTRGATVIMHDGKVPDEKWLESISPKQVGDFKMMVLENGSP